MKPLHTHSGSFAPLVGVFCAVLVSSGPALAKRAPDATATKAAPAALREIEAVGETRLVDGAKYDLGAETGLLRHFYARLAAPAAGKAASPRAAAEAFLLSHAPEIGFDSDRFDTQLLLASEKPSLSGTHFRYEQMVGNVPVYRGDIVVKVANSGSVSSLHSNFRPGLVAETTPAFEAQRAIDIAVAAVQPTGKPLGDFGAVLYVAELEGRGARLAYRATVPVEAPMGDWVVWVDARTGEVLGVEDQMVYVNGTGRVFDPDPRTKMNDASLTDQNDSDAAVPFPAAYDNRTLLDITNTAGTYSLNGPYARLLEFETPVVAPVTTTDPNAFLYQRSPSGFEDVMCYFHIDQNQRYIQGLGFSNINNRVQEIDSHGLDGADNSHYVISTRRLAFGEGGVDDAEDADVVLHEYGHSIQHDIVPGWGGGQEGAMGEGFGDYWAGSYSVAVNPTFRPSWMFTWDGHNEFWPGRVLVDSTKHYPEDCCGQVHTSGTLWCSGITDVLRRIGRPVMDRLVLDHHFALGTSATMADAANQVIQSDIDLYGGAHLQTIVTVFDFWGFVDASTFVPTIAHTPLTDTENTTGPYVVVATITATQPLDTGQLKVYYGVGAFSDSLVMTATGNPNEFAASIPGPYSGVDLRYYIRARDIGGGVATHPAAAPASFHEFHIGADTEPPVIVHSPLPDYPRASWPAAVFATITDNLGVDPSSVQVEWRQNGTPQTDFALARVGATDVFTGTFPSDTTLVAIGDSIAYRVVAADLATTPNGAASPASGFHAFAIVDILGRILVLDDDEVAKAPETKVVEREDGTRETMVSASRDAGDVGQAASSMASILTNLGYLTVVEAVSTSNPATWSTYDLLVHSSGANESPVANAGYRTALESWVAGGGKLLVEGGEVVYDAASTPGYPTFAANVLHTNDWDADNAGSLNLLAAQTGHPIATAPNALPATLPITYTGFGSQDSYKPLAPAYIVYGVTAQPGNGGILVYDDNPSPQSAQIVVFGFDFKDLGDLATRTALLENTVRYLLAPEGGANGAAAGNVRLANQVDHSGVTVTATPGGASAVTNAAGDYQISGLFAGTYTLTATKTGYATEVRAGVVVGEGQTAGDQDFVLYPHRVAQACQTPNQAIPDGSAFGLTKILSITDTWAVQGVEVDVDIQHTAIGDLVVEIIHGGKTVRLHNRTGGTNDNIVGTYPTTLTVSGPGALGDFTGDPANGNWSLRILDQVAGNTGMLVSWCIRLRGPADTTVDTGPGPEVEALFASRPNPAPEGRTTIRFGLRGEREAVLGIYDVAGRRVRTLLQGRVPAGPHEVAWDGRDAHGRAVAAGVYLYRLEAGDLRLTRKLVVVR